MRKLFCLMLKEYRRGSLRQDLSTLPRPSGLAYWPSSSPTTGCWVQITRLDLKSSLSSVSSRSYIIHTQSWRMSVFLPVDDLACLFLKPEASCRLQALIFVVGWKSCFSSSSSWTWRLVVFERNLVLARMLRCTADLRDLLDKCFPL